MKQYDRHEKEWVTDEELEKRVTIRKEKSKYCRGKKPHDYVLVLPYGVTYNEEYKFDPEVYYQMAEERYKFIEQQIEKLKEIGIVDRHWNHMSSRFYMCSVCKKRKYN